MGVGITWPCGALSNDGDSCDLANPDGHGGTMHTGVRNGVRIWWDAETGDLMGYSLEALAHG